MALEQLFPKPIRPIVGIILDIIGVIGWISLKNDLQAWNTLFGWLDLYLPIGFPMFLIPLIFVIVGTSLLLWDIGRALSAWIQRPRRFAEIHANLIFAGMESRRERKVDVDLYPYCPKHPFHQLVSHPTRIRHQLDLRCSEDGCQYHVSDSYEKLEAS